MNKSTSDDKNTKFGRFFNDGFAQLSKIFPQDTTVFLTQFLRHPYDIGAIVPSSTALSQAMTRFIQNNDAKKGKKYLEVGAGTGAFTTMIIEKLNPNDSLDVIEINPAFCENLAKKYSQNPNVTIHVGSILDWNPGYSYESIVSSLPFQAFSAKFVEDILYHYKELLSSGGTISYFEYLALPTIRKIFLNADAKKKLKKTMGVTHRFNEAYQFSTEKVLTNFPPACVHHCRMTTAEKL